MSDEVPSRLVNGVMVPLTQAEIAVRADEEAAWAVRVAPPRLIAKTAIYRRASDDEMGALDAFLRDTATPRQRLMWSDAEGGLVYVSDVLPIAEGLFGAERAATLLAP